MLKIPSEIDFRGITIIWNFIAQILNQSRAFFDFPKQQNAGVGSDMSTFKIGKDLIQSEAGKPERLFITSCHVRKAFS
jgi:hypothetical protein